MSEQVFNPSLFGIEEYVPKSGKRVHRSDSNYLIVQKKGRKNPDDRNLKLSICGDVRNFATGLFGDRVAIGMDDKGRIFIWEGNTVKISTNGGVHREEVENARGDISVKGLLEKAQQIFGDFRRVYYKMAPFSNGNAIVFTPTGEIDKL